MSRIGAVFFDLDGTLADTAPDLADALNRLLAEYGRPSVLTARIRPEISGGSAALVRLGFGLAPDDPRFAALRARFLELYRERLCVRTRLFPGMDATLAALAARGILWGVVTDKPAVFTEPLLERLGVRRAAACVVSGDCTKQRKPHPQPVLEACRLTGQTPERCLYIGDARRDIAAGRAAGTKTLTALFGYIRASDNPLEWGADGAIGAPPEILDWLDRHG